MSTQQELQIVIIVIHSWVKEEPHHAALLTFAAGSLTLQAALLTSYAEFLTRISLQEAEK